MIDNTNFTASLSDAQTAIKAKQEILPNDEALIAHLANYQHKHYSVGAIRACIINWLEWIDPDGCYSDEECAAQGAPSHTLPNLLWYICYHLDDLTIA